MSGLAAYADLVHRLAGGELREDGRGWVFRCPLPAHRRGDEHPSGWLRLGRGGRLLVGCQSCHARASDYAAYCGLPMTAFFPPKDRTPGPPVKRACVARYRYRDAAGVLVATKSRWEPGFDGRRKDFSWERPAPPELRLAAGVPDGAEAVVGTVAAGRVVRAGARKFRAAKAHESGGWDCPGVELPPYRLPELLAAHPARPVLVVEGEGKADLLAALGLVATCGPSGSKWVPAHSPHLAGRRVTVLPDGDAAGVVYAEAVVAGAVRGGAAGVRVAELPRPENHAGTWDVKDWLKRLRAAGADDRRVRLELFAIVNRAKEYAAWAGV